MAGTVDPFRSTDFDIKPKSIFLGELVGKGNFSKVYKGLYLGKEVAIKKQEITDAELETYLLNELAILRFCNHEHIVKYNGASKPSDNEIWSITEYIPGGDLKLLIASKIEIGWHNKVNILWKTANALNYLHENNIIHRDVKTDNVMLTLDLSPKLIDLGFAREVEPWPSSEPPEKMMTTLGTDDYMAPEVTFAMPYHFPADVFSFGLTMYEVCCNKVPTRTPRNGFCLEWEEAREELSGATTPNSLSLLIEQSAADEGIERLDMLGVAEWLEELHQDLKNEAPKAIHLKEEDVLRAIHSKWAEILRTGEDASGNTKIDPSDLETGFLAENVPEGKLNEEMKLRRISVNRALKQTELVPIEDEYETEPESSEIGFAQKNEEEEQIKSVLKDNNPTLYPPPIGAVQAESSKATRSVLKRSGTAIGRKLASFKSGTKNKAPENKASLKNAIKGNSNDTSMVGHGWNIKISGKTRRTSNTAKLKNRKQSSPLRRKPRRVRKTRVKNTGAAQQNDGPKAGYVNKKNNFGFLSWVREYLVLTNEGLLYFKNEDRSELKGALLFMDMLHPNGKGAPAIILSVAIAGKPFCFQILTNERKIVFQAATGTDRDQWLRQINEGYLKWEKAEQAKKR